MPRSRSQDVQSVPAGGVQIPHWTVPTLPQKKPISKSSDGRLKEFLANKLQAYRQRVTHLKTKERIGSKDERKQRWDCKAEFPALTVAAAALPRQIQTTQKISSALSQSCLQQTVPRPPTSSRGSTASPRSPTRTAPPSTTS